MIDTQRVINPVENRFQPQQPQQPSSQTLGTLRTIRDLDITNKAVLMRLDFNVPLETREGQVVVADDTRIREAIPTITYALEHGAKLIIASHLGRPDGKRSPEFSLEPVALHLAQLLDKEVTLAEDCVGEGIEMMVKSLRPGQILLLENLRFHAEEEANDPKFAAQLARLAEVYITDAFGTAHRKHASTYGVPSLIHSRGMGFLIEKELAFLDRIAKDPKKPFYAVLGGSKVSDKIKTIDALLRQIDGLVIGGAMAHAFWAVQGDTVPEGAKQPKPADIEAAKQVLASAKRKGIPVIVPADTNGGFDIGPKTVERFIEFLKPAKTIFWNGPLGWFEKPEYAVGTFEVAKAVAQLNALKVVGGGDTVSAIKQSGVAAGFDHLSTGGGAVLEFLELGALPGIDVLRATQRNPQSAALQ